MKTIKFEEIEETLDTLVTSILKESNVRSKKSKICEYLSKNKIPVEDPDEFNCLVVYPIMEILHTFIAAQFKDNNALASRVYINYNFFESNVSKLCEQFYGSACCVDKARYLLKAAIKWKGTGELPIFNWEQEYTYHYPKKGTPKQWMDFIDSLSFLLSGNNKKYLDTLKALVEVHMEG